MQQSRQNRRRRKHITQLGILLLLCLVLIFLIIHVSRQKPHGTRTITSQHSSVQQIASKARHHHDTIEARTIVRNQTLDDYLRRVAFNGTAMVVRDNRIVLDKGYGYADFAKQRRNSPLSTYYIASIQKSLIATAIMQLQEQGKLHVTDSLARYLPRFPNGNAITLYHLLTHTSGIVGHREGSHYISRQALIADIQRRGVRGPVGRWQYNDSNYSLLAFIVEKVSHQSIEAYLKTHVFQKAGLTQTGFYRTYWKQQNPTTGYRFVNGKRITPFLLNLSQLYGCGNIYMSASDLYRFDHALMTGRLIGADSLRQMMTPNLARYGFGFYDDPGSYSNHGVLPGWNVLNSFSHSGRTYVILLSNIENSGLSFGLMNEHIYEILNQEN